MWTNKQIWEFEQLNEELTFDTVYAKRNDFESWNTKMANPNEFIRDVVDRTFENFLDGYELWISNKDQGKLDAKYVAYIMSVMAGVVHFKQFQRFFKAYFPAFHIKLAALKTTLYGCMHCM